MNVQRLAVIAGLLVSTSLSTNAASISGVWANDGGDKVSQDELRWAHDTQNLTGKTKNHVWNGSKLTLFAAKNETVSFQLILESALTKASSVSVQFNVLTGPNNWKIRTSGADPMNFVNRPIELFYERYLKIYGLSFFGYANENSQIPLRFRAASRNWVDRPDHDKMYPDPLVPIELVKTFDIQPGQNQSIWCDIFVPKRAPAGLYKGSVKVYEGSTLVRRIPVELSVKGFTLPDVPTAKTMLFVDNSAINHRYVSGSYSQWDQPSGRKMQSVMDKHYQLLHRHKMSAIGENECPFADRPCDSSIQRLDGSLYTNASGYDGVGIGTPNNVYSIGTYGTWGSASYGVPDWKHDQNLMNQHLNGFGSWFQQNLPTTDVFLYLQDEPGVPDFGQVETWAKWMKQSTGAGSIVKSMATVSAVHAMSLMPDLQFPFSSAGVGNCPLNQSCNNTTTTQQAHDYFSQPGRAYGMYNDGRPGVGTFDTESDGTDPRVLPIAQYKMGVNRWYYWDSNIDNGMDTFATATTWGNRNRVDRERGQWGDVATNGNGLLIYPGTDIAHTANSYGLLGPIASIRLKNWRRGIQDVDYFALAAQKNPALTKQILNNLIPKAIWENTVSDVNWPIAPVSWSSDPSTYEDARAQLATIIAGGTPIPAPIPVPTPVPTPVPAPVPTPTPTTTGTSVPAPDFALTSWTLLISKNSGKCMESVADNTITGPFQQKTCINSEQQKLQFVPVDGGYRVNSLRSGLQFDIAGGEAATEDSRKLIQYPYWGGKNEIFWLEKAATPGYYLIHPKHSGKCLDVDGQSKEDGAAIQQWSCNGQDNQQWMFTAAARPSQMRKSQ